MIRKFLISFLVIIMVLIFVSIMAWQLNYIDETISIGEGYGFAIDESKQESINRIKDEALKLNSKAVKVGDSPKEYKVIPISSLQISGIVNYDTWVVMLDSDVSFLNTIKLDYENDRIVRIHRHKQLFELP